MSSNQPPAGPPSSAPPPPSGPPPAGPPPAGPPPAGPPPTQPSGSGGGKRRGLLIGGGVVGALALGVAGFVAYAWFNGGGPQPAEALPADTLGYMSVDLDPTGKQKIEAYNTLKRFPAAKEWLDREGLEADSDLLQKLWEEAEDDCDGDVSYEDDVKPWIGKRFAMAAVPGDDTPDPVGVVQVTDGDAADKGVKKLIDECGDGGDDQGGFTVAGDWLVIAETTEIAERVASDAEQGNLADDEDFQKWTGEAGEAGILTAYMSEEAGAEIAENLGALEDAFGGMPGSDADSFSSDDFGDDYFGESGEDPLSGGPDEEAVKGMLERVGGMAMTMRFSDGSLEVELAGDIEGLGIDGLVGSTEASELVASLPEDTAFAYGLGLPDGWATELIDYSREMGVGSEVDMLISQAQQLGITLPGDLETLLGEAVALAVSGDIDASQLGFGGFDDLPVGLKIKGDTDDAQGVLDRLKATAPSPEEAELLGSDADGDMLAVGPSGDYRKALLGEGTLGDGDIYRDVIREDDAGFVAFVNFDAGGGWLEKLVEDDADARANIAPLAGFGAASWMDDNVVHAVLRVTTNKE